MIGGGPLSGIWQQCARGEIPWSVFQVLAYLGAAVDPQSPLDVSRDLGLNARTVRRAVAALVDLDLVERRRAGRSVLLVATTPPIGGGPSEPSHKYLVADAPPRPSLPSSETRTVTEAPPAWSGWFMRLGRTDATRARLKPDQAARLRLFWSLDYSPGDLHPATVERLIDPKTRNPLALLACMLDEEGRPEAENLRRRTKTPAPPQPVTTRTDQVRGDLEARRAAAALFASLQPGDLPNDDPPPP